MIKEYKYGIFIKVIGIICSLILMAFSIAIFFIPDLDKNEAFNLNYIFIPLAIIFLPLSVLGIRDVLVSKVTITNDFILSKTAISSRKLRFEEIFRFKYGENYIHVYPTKRSFKKKLKFSKFLCNIDEIEVWLLKNYENIELVEKKEEVKEFFRDSTHGFSDLEKRNKLQKALKVAKGVNIASVVFTVIALFLKKYVLINAFILISIPVLIIGVVFYFKGLIKFGDKEKGELTIYPSVFWGMASPVFLFFLSILFTVNIYDFKNVWLPLTSLSFTVFILCIISSKEYIIKHKKSYNKITMLFVITVMYSYAILIFINIFFDKNNKESYKGFIEKKMVSKGKHSNTYNLVLNVNDLDVKSKNFTVTKSIYKKAKIKEDVKLILKQGALRISYYEIELNENRHDNN